jgi:hypothetical protein
MEHDEYVSEGYACDQEDWQVKYELQAMLGIRNPMYEIIQRPNNLIVQAKSRYDTNAQKKVGETCACPSCGKNFVKRSYQQKFHSIKCKDIYWNSIDDTRRERAKFYNR